MNGLKGKVAEMDKLGASKESSREVAAIEVRSDAKKLEDEHAKLLVLVNSSIEKIKEAQEQNNRTTAL